MHLSRTRRTRRTRRGVTLIEVVVAAVVIGLLGSFAVVSFGSTRENVLNSRAARNLDVVALSASSAWTTTQRWPALDELAELEDAYSFVPGQSTSAGPGEISVEVRGTGPGAVLITAALAQEATCVWTATATPSSGVASREGSYPANPSAPCTAESAAFQAGY